MGQARSKTVDFTKPGVFHCYNRCVRRAFLTGKDAYSGKDYSHRKDWLEDRLCVLTEIFSIEVAGFAAMDNHFHVVIRTDPQAPQSWEAGKVAECWLKLFPPKGFEDLDAAARQVAIEALAGDADRIAELRVRLGNVSWFMRCLQEPIARRANVEEEAAGRFWQGRFGCEELLDDAAVLACMVYLDLNPIRAGKAETPEASDHTSIQRRIECRQAFEKGRALCEANADDGDAEVAAALGRLPRHAEDGLWLAPIESHEEDRARHDPSLPISSAVVSGAIQGGETVPIASCSTSPRRGLLNMSLDAYIELVDWTGRAVRGDKRGAIPSHLRPILDRLEIDVDRWVRTMRGLSRRWGSVIGGAAARAAEAVRRGVRWVVSVFELQASASRSTA